MIYLSLDAFWAFYSDKCAKLPLLTQHGRHRLLVAAGKETLPYPVNVAAIISDLTYRYPVCDETAFCGLLQCQIQSEANDLARTKGPWECVIPWKEIWADFDAWWEAHQYNSWEEYQNKITAICEEYIPYRINYDNVWLRFEKWFDPADEPVWARQRKHIGRLIQEAANVAVNVWD